MRLIDADALKEKLKPCEADAEVCENSCEGCQFRVVTAEEIDNAPTVDVISNEEGYEMYGKGYLQEYERGKSERTRGEWIFRQGITFGGYYKCNICGEVERAEKNFCPNCGAKMKGGAE